MWDNFATTYLTSHSYIQLTWAVLYSIHFAFKCVCTIKRPHLSKSLRAPHYFVVLSLTVSARWGSYTTSYYERPCFCMKKTNNPYKRNDPGTTRSSDYTFLNHGSLEQTMIFCEDNRGGSEAFIFVNWNWTRTFICESMLQLVDELIPCEIVGGSWTFNLQSMISVHITHSILIHTFSPKRISSVTSCLQQAWFQWLIFILICFRFGNPWLRFLLYVWFHCLYSLISKSYWWYTIRSLCIGGGACTPSHFHIPP